MRGIGGKFPASYFLPLNVLEAVIAENPKSSLYSVKSLSVKHPLVDLRENLYKNTITLFLSEVLYRVVKDGTKEPGLYEWCEREILLLNALKADFSNFHIRFLVELCGILGFSPSLSDLEPFLGDLAPSAAGSSRDLATLAEGFLGTTFEQAMLVPLTGTSRSALAEKLLKYIEFHCESAVSVKSLKILHDLLK